MRDTRLVFSISGLPFFFLITFVSFFLRILLLSVRPFFRLLQLVCGASFAGDTAFSVSRFYEKGLLHESGFFSMLGDVFLFPIHTLFLFPLARF